MVFLDAPNRKGSTLPRKARQISESGIYHVILRGINKQSIFEDDEDAERFLGIIEGYKGISGFELYAYCLMSNHVHLLIRVREEPLSMIFRRIASKYVYWFNAKYDRIGHLFQERFKSEPVEDDAYFLTVLRYIHNNPVKAGICKRAEDYPLSSYRDYLSGCSLIDTAFALSIMTLPQLVEFTRSTNDDECMDAFDHVRARFTDADARRVMEDITGCSSVEDFQSLDDADKRGLAAEMIAAGLSIRQISRITGMTIGKVRGCKGALAKTVRSA